MAIKNFFLSFLGKLGRIPHGFYVVTGVYLLVFFLMLPFREIANEDDFAYFLTLKNFLNSGVLKVNEWAVVAVVFQTFWGSLFSFIFGFSFKTLHFSSIFLFYFGLISFYFTLKELNVKENRAVIFSLMLFAFPKILFYLYSFMSDGYYLSLVLISIYFAVKTLKTEKIIFAVLTSLFSALALLTRQTGLVLGLSLFIALLVKSWYKRKLLAFQIIGSLSIVLPTFVIYSIWLGQDGNMTSSQMIFVVNNYKYLKKYFLPVSYRVLRPTNDIYDEIIFRMSIYTSWLIGILSPIILFFRGCSVKKLWAGLLKNRKVFFIGSLILIFILSRLTTRFKDYDVQDHIFFPSYSVLSSEIIGYKVSWNKIWSLILLISFPFWAYIFGSLIVRLNSLLLKIRKNRKTFFLITYFVISAAILARYAYFGKVQEGIGILDYMFFALLWWLIAGVVFFYIWNFYPNLKPKDSVKNAIIIFLIGITGGQMLLVALSFMSWQQYIFPFVPIFLIMVSYLTAKWKWRPILSTIIVSLILLFSVYTTKTDYDRYGIIWETAEEAVNKKLVEATEAGVVSWGWIPFHYHEESFEKRLAEVGGDKKLINQDHTWWDDPAYKFKDQKLWFTNTGCDGVALKQGEEIYKEVEATSVFKTYRYCAILKR